MRVSRTTAAAPAETVRLRSFRLILAVVSGAEAEDDLTLSRALALAGADACTLKVLLMGPEDPPPNLISRLFGPTVAATVARNARYRAGWRALE